jgi:hypothetical protein
MAFGLSQGLPGDRLTGSQGARLAALLARQNTNNGTTAGGLAHALQQGMMGLMMKRDIDAANEARAQQAASTKNLAEALKVGMGTPASTKVIGEDQTMFGGADPQMQTTPAVPADPRAMMQMLASDPINSRLASQLMLSQITNAQQQPSSVREFEFAKSQGFQGSFEDFKKIGTASPSNVQEWQFYSQLSPEMQERYLTMKRANRPMDIGGSVVVPSQTVPGAVTGEIPKTPPPEQMPDFKGQQTTAVQTATNQADREKNFTKAQTALNQFEQQTQMLTDTIDKALQLAQSPWATGYGNMALGGLPNTEARALNNYLNTIKANIGFDRLQQMREASPTGGALGAVSEMENRLLQAVQGALDPMQQGQLVQNLQTIRQLYPTVLEEKRRAFNQDYGAMMQQRQGQPPAAPAPGSPPPLPGNPADLQALSDEEVLRRLGITR